MSKSKYVGRSVKINGLEGVVIYVDRAGLFVEFEDGSQWMGPKDSASIEWI